MRQPETTKSSTSADLDYLPSDGAFGEMVRNVGKVVYLARKGVDGIVDRHQSLYLHERALYASRSTPAPEPRPGLPIHNFYFDGTQSDLGRDLAVYLELARGYRKKKG